MITKAQKKRFEDLCNGLKALMDEIREKNPEANYYLAADDFHLMKGPSHDDSCRAQRSNSVASVFLPGSGGGDW